jgi:hypothetical protein
VSYTAELEELREAWPRWTIYADAFRFLFVARLIGDETIKITADDPAELAELDGKIARRQARYDRLSEASRETRPVGYIRPYLAAPGVARTPPSRSHVKGTAHHAS